MDSLRVSWGQIAADANSLLVIQNFVTLAVQRTFEHDFMTHVLTSCVCFVFHRRVRTVGRQPRGVAAGEVSVRARGVRALAVPEPADALRQAAAASPVTAHRLGAGHRAALLRAPRR